METLHAYWRMEYIEAPKTDEDFGNPFLSLPELGDDKEALIIYRGQQSYLILNKYPYNPGHLLTVPYREVAELSDLEVDERNDLMATIIKGKETLQKTFNPDGFNIGFNFGCSAGAGIPTHLHCHIVPRWEGDSNFMPVIGKTKVLPEALADTWEKLKANC